MDWRGLLDRMLGRPALSALADEAAARCRTAVWELVHRQTRQLRRAEARGYIRVRSMGIVREAVRETVRRHPALPAAACQELQQLTMEAVLRRAAHDLTTSEHTQQSPLRKAA